MIARLLLVLGFLSLGLAFIAAFLHEARANPVRAMFNIFATIFHVHLIDGKPTPMYIVWLFVGGALALAGAFLLMHFQ